MSPMPSCSAEGPAFLALTPAGQQTTPLPWLHSGAHFVCAAFASFHFVDAPAGAALLELWALACTGKVSLTTGYTPGCAYALAVRVAAALAALVLQDKVRCSVHLEGYRKPNSSEGESSLHLDPTLPRQNNVR